MGSWVRKWCIAEEAAIWGSERRVRRKARRVTRWDSFHRMMGFWVWRIRSTRESKLVRLALRLGEAEMPRDSERVFLCDFGGVGAATDSSSEEMLVTRDIRLDASSASGIEVMPMDWSIDGCCCAFASFFFIFRGTGGSTFPGSSARIYHHQ